MRKMRSKNLRTGLIDFIKYIQNFYDTKELQILEVGSWSGESAEIFSEYFKKVICVDAWSQEILEDALKHIDIKKVEETFDRMISKKNNIIKIKKLSTECAKNFEEQIDIVYIDGDHSYEGCKKDLIAWLPKARLFISGHDYWKKRFDGVIKAVDEIVGKPDAVFRDYSWIKRNLRNSNRKIY